LAVATGGARHGWRSWFSLCLPSRGFSASITFGTLLFQLPIIPQLSAWYSGTGLALAVLMLAFAVYAFHASLGGRPMFQAKLLED